MRTMRRRVKEISLFGVAGVKTSFLQGIIKLKIFFLKTEYEGQLRISKLNLFH